LKIQSFYDEVSKNKRPYAEYKALQPKIQRFYNDKVPGLPGGESGLRWDSMRKNRKPSG
jgi:hypothetical protein